MRYSILFITIQFFNYNIMGYIYAIVKNESNKTLSKVSEYIRNISNIPLYRLCEYHNYSISLNEQYSSCLPFIYEKDLSSYEKQLRREAVEFEETSCEVKKKYNPIAISHRKGGFTTIDWRFNDDVSFLISTNFGYGMSSYFYSKYFYKGIMLAPYSFYVKYKRSNYASVVRCTYEYDVNYNSWTNVMDDCISFYNAVVFNNENHIFEWLTNHLNIMVSELEKFLNASSANFLNEYINRSHISGYTSVSGDDFWIIKSKKIAYSLDFIDNIKILPIQINPETYVSRLLKLCKDFIPQLNIKIENTNLILLNLEKNLVKFESEEDYPLYNRLYSKYYYKKDWYLYSNKFKMIWFLMHVKQRLHINISLSDIKTKINQLNIQIKKIDKCKSEINVIKTLLLSLVNDRDKINNYFMDNI